MAPEVLLQEAYSELSDWWSVGVIMFEMLAGWPPFCSDQGAQVCASKERSIAPVSSHLFFPPQVTTLKILNWEKTLPQAFAYEAEETGNISPVARDLIQRFLSPQNVRIGINGVEEIMQHPFFAGIDWRNIRNTRAPIVPEIRFDEDLINFDDPKLITPEQERAERMELAGTPSYESKKHFWGFTFNRDHTMETVRARLGLASAF